MFKLLVPTIFLLLVVNCKSNQQTKLEVVTHHQFEQFVEATNYVTDAERYGWSFVQQNVFDFKAVKGATWRLPDGVTPLSSRHLPVTQVSYNDAIAYCT